MATGRRLEGDIESKKKCHELWEEHLESMVSANETNEKTFNGEVNRT